MFPIINNYRFISSLNKVRLNNVILFILHFRMWTIYFISKPKGAVDPKSLKTTELYHAKIIHPRAEMSTIKSYGNGQQNRSRSDLGYSNILAWKLCASSEFVQVGTTFNIIMIIRILTDFRSHCRLATILAHFQLDFSLHFSNNVAFRSRPTISIPRYQSGTRIGTNFFGWEMNLLENDYDL
jgi:hypothetical protein